MQVFRECFIVERGDKKLQVYLYHKNTPVFLCVMGTESAYCACEDIHSMSNSSSAGKNSLLIGKYREDFFTACFGYAKIMKIYERISVL